MLSQRAIWLQAGLFAFCRLIIFTPIRMIYPFLPALARGLDSDLPTLSLAVSLSMLTSAAAPFLASIAERSGRKTALLVGLVLFCAGAALLPFWAAVPAFFLMLFLINLGDNVFGPASQAYLADHIPYERRGRVMAVIEMGWPLSLILVTPLVGVLIDRFGWQSPFIWLAAGGMILVIMVARAVPRDAPPALSGLSLLTDLRGLLTHRPVIAGMLVGLLMVFGNQVVGLVFGAWMEDSFGLKVTALGLASMIIGAGELGGQIFSAGIMDRIGKHRAVAAGLLINLLAALSLRWLGGSLAASLAWLGVFFFTSEFALISTMPIMSEVAPRLRATAMTVYFSAITLGIALGAWLAPLIYTRGMSANGLAAAACNLLALLALTQVKLEKPGASA